MKHAGGNVWKRITKDGETRFWYRRRVRLFDNGAIDDVRKALRVNSFEAAYKRAKELDERYDALERGEQPRLDMTLGGYGEKYIAQVRDERKLLSWKTIRSAVEAFTGRIGAHVPLRRITQPDFQSYLAWQNLLVKPPTVHGHFRAVSRMFNVAVSEGYLDKNPAVGVRLPKPRRAEPRIPSGLEVQKVQANLKRDKRWLYRITLTLAHTACRLGEALTLTWDAVDFTQEKLTLNRRKVNDELKIPMAGPLKQELWEMWMERGMPGKGFLFVSRSGKPLNAANVLTCYKPVVRELGMEWMTLKIFRKYAATAIYEKTGNVRMVQMLLGHTTVQTTELYLGRGAEARKKAVEALAEVLAEDFTPEKSEAPESLGTSLGTRSEEKK